MKSGTSLAESAVNAASAGVGHYKGVMLCNRPFAGTQANHKLAAGTSADKGTFTCGVVPEKIGVNVPIPIKEKVRPTLLLLYVALYSKIGSI